MKLRLFFIIILAISLPMAGCGLPKDLKKEAEAQHQQIMDIAKKISEKAQAYQGFAQTNEFGKFAAYAEREKWEDWLKDSQDLLDKGKATYDLKVTPLLEANKKEQAAELSVALATVRGELRKANNTSERVEKRIAFLKETMANAGPMVEKAEGEYETLSRQVDSTSQVLAKAKTDYPGKVQDIDSRFSPILNLNEASAAALDKAHVQLALHKAAENADYAVLGDSCVAVSKNLQTEKDSCSGLEKRIAQLYKSYSKILNDMRVDFFAVIGRTSWDNNAEYDRDNDYIYSPVQVDEDTYELLATVPENSILGHAWGNSVNPQINKEAWASLKINPSEGMSSWDDEAQFWLSDLDAKFYHKYLTIEGATQRETDWVPVDEDFFDKYEGALGMTIMSKPYGMYEDEAITEPTPPGMEYVGNSKYGEWRQNSSGRSFWHWYGQYAFFRMLMGNRHYYRGDYDHWYGGYRGRRPYYGRGTDTWGTSSTHGRTRYSNSYYGRSGGFSTQGSTVRGSGPATRGGGPGGLGK